MASVLKNKMIGVHMQVLAPILNQMEYSDLVVTEADMPCPLSPQPVMPCPLSPQPGMPCPLSPPIEFASIQLLQASRLAHLDECTPTKSQRIEKKITGEKFVKVGDSNMMDPGMPCTQSQHGGCDVQVGHSSIGKCLDPELVLDEHGWSTLFGDILQGLQAMQDDNSSPSMVAGNEVVLGDYSLPTIKPINPNVKARKLEVTAAAKASLEDDLENGIAPTVRKK